MSDALEQFRQTFLEESSEGLDAMESRLLALQPGESPEVINEIFRAAHSIKGGAGSVGLAPIGDFTHGVETLLDQLRRGDRAVDAQVRDTLLRAVDCLRGMVEATRAGRAIDTVTGAEVERQVQALLAQGAAGSAAVQAAAAVPAAGGWSIAFRPALEMLHSGNDPVRMFRELAALGPLEVRCDASALPALVDLVPEDCYLAWDLELRGPIEESKVREIFAWVDGECDLRIEPLAAAQPAAAAAPAMVSAPVPAAAASAPAPHTSALAAKPESVAEIRPAVPANPPEVRSGVERRSGGDRRSGASSAETSSIRVETDKIDVLVNMVGELVITQSMLGQVGRSFDLSRLDALNEGLTQLERNTRELQEAVMRIRMLPISFVFNRIPRIVHDLSAKLGKRVELVTEGERTELDKTVLEKLGDPLVHIVRNSLDHGIETVEERRAAGKPETGTLQISACHQGGNVIIEIADDGRGLSREKILEKARAQGLVGPDETPPDDKLFPLIFHAGFSTAKVVTDVSGRGVGMDVVRRNIKELGGTVNVSSEQGKGLCVRIRLPLTLAILDGQLLRVGRETYIAPLVSIVELTQARPEQISTMAGRVELFRLREEYIPIVRLHSLFEVPTDLTRIEAGLLLVVESERQRAALFVEELLSQQQIVIKSLETNYRPVPGISGATILGDGTVAMILDVPGLLELCSKRQQRVIRHGSSAPQPEGELR